MRYRWNALWIGMAASMALVVTAYAGGWAILTVRDLPEYAVAGTPLEVRFMVRQHGISPLDGLEPRIAARLEMQVVEAPAVATRETGEYTTTLVLPGPGVWQIQALDAFGSFTLPDLTVIAEGASAPHPLSEEALGKRLFVAKGCIGCHVNREVDVPNLVSMGPDLTGKRFPETFLENFLADPRSALGQDSETEYGNMPDLDLTEPEIAALTAFVNRDRRR